MKTVKYGILGCGEHALQSHALPGKGIPGLRLAALCDISQGHMASFEKAYGKKLAKFTNKDEFMQSGIDAVLISTPDEFHYSELAAAIKYGLHAFVEKPIAISCGQITPSPSSKKTENLGLERLLQAASEKSLVVSSCHPRRYDPPFMWLKENLPMLASQLGKPIAFEFDFSYHKPSEKWKLSRSLLLDHANHELDLLNYLFGHASISRFNAIDGFDIYRITGLRDDRILFSIGGTRRLESREYMEWVRMRFDRGNIVLDAHKGIVEIHNHDKKAVKHVRIKPTDYGLRGRMTLVNFVNAINGAEECYLTHKDLLFNNICPVMLKEGIDMENEDD